MPDRPPPPVFEICLSSRFIEKHPSVGKQGWMRFTGLPGWQMDRPLSYRFLARVRELLLEVMQLLGLLGILSAAERGSRGWLFGFEEHTLMKRVPIYVFEVIWAPANSRAHTDLSRIAKMWFDIYDVRRTDFISPIITRRIGDLGIEGHV
ncbi:unnamed protein product [Tuber aestivum]|uniref:Uncharacterized protein n=1 Tax=Tuber aestivum TaxID=59557 RepID=A0A292Q8K7_9PEZI|nr:unnamed protein product [Tuber aestivum]